MRNPVSKLRLRRTEDGTMLSSVLYNEAHVCAHAHEHTVQGVKKF